MTFNFAKAAFMIEILLAELIFLFPAEKRPLFPLRYAGLFLLCIVIGGFFPIEYTDGLLAQFLMFFLMFLITVGAMALCFSVSFSVGFSAGFSVGFSVSGSESSSFSLGVCSSIFMVSFKGL